MIDAIVSPRQKYQYPALNAFRHGLFTRQHVLLEVEDPVAYEAFFHDIVFALQPVGADETFVAMRIASLQWRLARLVILETAVLGKPASSEVLLKTLDRLSLYEMRLNRQLDLQRKALAELQKKREGDGPQGVGETASEESNAKTKKRDFVENAGENAPETPEEKTNLDSQPGNVSVEPTASNSQTKKRTRPFVKDCGDPNLKALNELFDEFCENFGDPREEEKTKKRGS